MSTVLYDHIFINSGKGEYNTSGIPQILDDYPPNKVLMFYLGELIDPPDELRDDVVNNHSGILLDPVKLTALGDRKSELGIQSMPFAIFQEMQSSISRQLSEHLSKDYSERKLVVTVAAGSSIHQSLLLALALSLNATLVTIDYGTGGNAIITQQHWINIGINSTNLTKAQQELFQSILIQLSLKEKAGNAIPKWMTAEEIIGALPLRNLTAATGLSNSAGDLIDKGLLQTESDSSPVKYRLSGRGWICALRLISEQLQLTEMPLSEITKDGEPELWRLYNSIEDVTGRVMGVRGVLADGKLKAIDIANNQLPVHAIISIYSRRYNEMTPKIIEDDGFDLTDPTYGSFIEVRRQWDSYLKSRNQQQLDWALFNATGDNFEESFRILCNWLWPKITGKTIPGADNQTRNIEWSIDSTHLDVQQNICMNIFCFLYPIPLSYVVNPYGGAGVTGRKIKFIANPSHCIITLPSSEIIQTIISKFGSNWQKNQQVLVALWLWKKHCKENEGRYQKEMSETDNPFGVKASEFEEIDEEVYIEDLHQMITLQIQSGELISIFAIDSGDWTDKTSRLRLQKAWGRAKDALCKYNLVVPIEQKGGTKTLLKLTPLGQIVAEILYYRHNEG